MESSVILVNTSTSPLVLFGFCGLLVLFAMKSQTHNPFKSCCRCIAIYSKERGAFRSLARWLLGNMMTQYIEFNSW